MSKLFGSPGKFALVCSVALFAAAPTRAGDVGIPFNAKNFSNPLVINNRFLPLVPGTVFIYRSETPDGCEENRVEVTNNKKKIAAGVTARPVHDVVYAGPCGSVLKITEDTFDWYAQDNDGNVWYLGEDSRNCTPSGCVQSEGSWEAGADIFHIGSLGVAGIIMLANPRKGDSYQQEFYEDHAEDIAAVQDTDADVVLSRPDARQPKLFHHCVVTKERSTLESGSVAQKFYCPGIGLMAEEDLSGGRVRGELIQP